MIAAIMRNEDNPLKYSTRAMDTTYNIEKLSIIQLTHEVSPANYKNPLTTHHLICAKLKWCNGIRVWSHLKLKPRFMCILFLLHTNREIEMNIIRLFSTGVRGAASSELAQLRKRTGFTLMNCRKALQLCDNDVTRAEAWLISEAKKLGWEKAVKLQSRSAADGLIAVAKSENKAVMVEVNCETDFVARNEKFVSLARLVASACLKHRISQSNPDINKVFLNEELCNLQALEGDTLGDCVLKRIGELGEKIVLRRAVCYESRENVNLAVSVHPPVSDSQDIFTGKYGAIVAFQMSNNARENLDLPSNLGIGLCKHIIGMNPQRIAGFKDTSSDNPGNEEVLLNQEYMFDPEVTVGELLEEHGVRVLDFQRFQCGEDDVLNEVDRTDLEESAEERKI